MSAGHSGTHLQSQHLESKGPSQLVLHSDTLSGKNKEKQNIVSVQAEHI